MKNKSKVKFTKEILEAEINNNLSRADIAKKYDCSHIMITNAMKKFGLKITTSTIKRRAYNKKDMTGFKIGSLEVIKEDTTKISPNGKHILMWECKCLCGKHFSTSGAALRQGKTKTCGCRINSKSKTSWKGYEEIYGTHWRNITENAKYRRIDFLITIEDAWNIFLKQNRKCVLTGEELILSPLSEKTASLDRIDNSKCYTIDNIQWIHKDVNKLKSNFNQTKFIEICKKIAKYNI